MIKEATLFDLPKVFEVSKELYATAINHQQVYTWDDESALLSLKMLITSARSTILIDEKNENITGLLIASLSTPPAGNNLIANDILALVMPHHQLRTLRRFNYVLVVLGGKRHR